MLDHIIMTVADYEASKGFYERALEPLGRPDHQWHAHRGIVHVPLLDQTMVAKAISMVRGEEHDRVLQHALLLQRSQNPADLLIDHGHIAEIVGPLSLPLLVCGQRIKVDRIGFAIGYPGPQRLQRLRLAGHLRRQAGQR